jgi:hypothetical protein
MDSIRLRRLLFTAGAAAVFVGGFFYHEPRTRAQGTSSVPALHHVFIVVGENQNYSSSYNSSAMPYLTSLANRYGLATNYIADTHPSIGNYEVLSAGQIFSNDDSQTPSSLPLSADNIALDLQNAGMTWKDYVEQDPNISGCGALNSGTYYVRQDPLEYYTNINRSANIVCFSQFATDLKSKALPNLSWLVPSGCDDAHDCSVGTFDNWLQTEIGPLLSSSYFQPGGDGLLIITWDEDGSGSTTGCTTSQIESGTWCGGQIETVIVSPAVTPGYQSTNSYHHESVLRMMEEALGLTEFPGASSNPNGELSLPIDMADFFSTSAGTAASGTTGSGSGLSSSGSTSSTGPTAHELAAATNSGSAYYVSTTGSDSSGTGSQSSPWATISHASSEISAGATVYVAAGTYTGNISTSASGTASSPITYQAETANFSGPVNCAQVTASQGSLSGCVQLVASTTGSVWYNSGSYVTISGFDISGPNIGMDTQALGIGGNYDTIIGNSVHNIATSSSCNGDGVSAIGMEDASNDIIDGNYVYNVGPSGCAYAQGIYPTTSATNETIENNIVAEVSSYAIQSWSNTGGHMIVNNTLLNSAGCVVLGTDVSGQTSSGNFVANNICDATEGGIEEQGYGSGATGTNNQYVDNLFYGCGTTYSLQNGLTGTGTVSSNPMFMNYTGGNTGNYALQSVSPAISAGTTTNAPSVDFMGNARPQDGPSMGAYQYMSGSSSGASASLSPTSLTFASQTTGTTSAAQTITLSNSGSAALSVSGVAISGTNSSEFAQTNTCGTSVAAGANCTISVTFTPSATGSASATLTVTNNSGGTSGSTQTASLSGTGASSSEPAAALSPTSVTFASQTTGTTSAAQTITLSNSGGAALGVSGVAISGTNSGDFAQTNTCGTSVAAGANCTISVTFKPSATGSASATLTVTDNSGGTSGSTQTAGISGTGGSPSGPAASLSPTSLTFASQNAGTTSAAQSITLSNTGSAALTITGITVTGTNSSAFAETSTCGSSVAAGANCAIGVTFTPSASGAASASLSVADNASGSPQSVTLSGTGASPSASTVSLSPASLTFAGQNAGTTSAAQSITLSNTGSAALTITGISVTGTNSSAFAQTNTCGSGVAAGAGCTIAVTFTPSASGAASASLSIADNASGSPQSVALSGSGMDFALSASSPSATVNPGQPANYSIAVVPQGGFNQMVMLSCTGAPAGASCSVSPSSATLNGTSPSMVAVTVATSSGSAATAGPWAVPTAGGGGRLLLGLVSLLAFLLLIRSPKPKRRNWQLGFATAGLLLLLAGCGTVGAGNSSSSGQPSSPAATVTPAGAYNLTITGSSTSCMPGPAQSVTLSLQVN